jgi:hypothetical protein
LICTGRFLHLVMEEEQKLLIIVSCKLSFDRMDIEPDDVNFEHIESFTLTNDVITRTQRQYGAPQCGRSRAVPAARGVDSSRRALILSGRFAKLHCTHEQVDRHRFRTPVAQQLVFLARPIPLEGENRSS